MVFGSERTGTLFLGVINLRRDGFTAFGSDDGKKGTGDGRSSLFVGTDFVVFGSEGTGTLFLGTGLVEDEASAAFGSDDRGGEMDGVRFTLKGESPLGFGSEGTGTRFAGTINPRGDGTTTFGPDTVARDGLGVGATDPRTNLDPLFSLARNTVVVVLAPTSMEICC